MAVGALPHPSLYRTPLRIPDSIFTFEGPIASLLSSLVASLTLSLCSCNYAQLTKVLRYENLN